jgi:hypothetical protein
MNHRILLPLLLLVIIIAASVGITIFSHSSHSTGLQTAAVVQSDQSNAQSESAVQAALQSQMAPGQQETLSTTVISGIYALQLWSDPNEAGEALLTYDASTDQWTLVTWGGGKWDADELVGEGVDQTDAQNLVALLPQ